MYQLRETRYGVVRGRKCDAQGRRKGNLSRQKQHPFPHHAVRPSACASGRSSRMHRWSLCLRHTFACRTTTMPQTTSSSYTPFSFFSFFPLLSCNGKSSKAVTQFQPRHFGSFLLLIFRFYSIQGRMEGMIQFPLFCVVSHIFTFSIY